MEGFYYVTQGYRKIPGNKCFGGIKLDPVKKACNSVAWMTSVLNLKTIGLSILMAACFYYGWPILEAIMILLPITDAKESLEKAKSYAGKATGFVQSAMSSGGPAQN